MNPFGNVQYVPGIGWVEGGYQPAPQQVRRGAGALGDESAVMMISGLGGVNRRGIGTLPLPGSKYSYIGEGDWETLRKYPAQPTGISRSQSTGVRPGTDVVLFGYVLPWWMWILVLGSAAYAGYLLMQKLKKGK